MQEAIESVYRTLAAYRHPEALKGCPCCTSEADGRPLLRAALRELSADALGRYAHKALSTWGSLDDYKYFLPRILELSATGDAPCDLEVTLGKLAYGGFPSWPQAERAAIDGFVHTLWATYVRQAAVADADALLCGAARLLDVAPLLEAADAIDRGFRDAYRLACASGRRAQLRNAFWDRDSAAYRRVLAWAHAQGAP